MNISLGRPFAICEKGRRQNNEDHIYPLSELANPADRLFIVCDGVGGSNKGEIAGSLACESIQTFFFTFLEEEYPSDDFIHKAIQYAETRFDEYTASHPEAKGMATTLTLVYIGNSKIKVAHIGDSRIYQFRNGHLIFRTEDHSLVSSLVQSGQISPEEALIHPQRNIITRAIQGTGRPVEPEVVCLTDIQPGDYLFMCTDGVMESMTDEALTRVFSENQTTESIKNVIAEFCSEISRDNYSFYILPIQNIQNSTNYKQFILSFFYSFI
jgi:protein phosphatase